MATQRRVGLTILAMSIVAIGFLTLSPTLAGHRPSVWCVICGRQVLGDLLLNVGLFVPVGVGLGLLRVPRGRALGIALIATTAIEITQGFLLHGRFASASDIVTNSTGAMLGHALGSRWHLFVFPTDRLARRLATGFLFAWLAILAGAAWALTPSLEPGAYRVVTLDDQSANAATDIVKHVELLRPVNDSQLEPVGPGLDAAIRRRELVLLARFRPTTADTVIAALQRIGAPPAISIRHGGGMLMIVVHTRARTLFLHEPTIFWGPLGYMASTRDSIVALAGGIDEDSVRLYTMEAGSLRQNASLGLSPALWLYLLIGAGPGMKFIIPLSALLNVAFLSPAMYWAMMIAARSQQQGVWRAVFATTILLVIVAAGFIGVPWLARLAPTPWVIWTSTLACMGLAGLAAWSAQTRRVRAP